MLVDPGERQIELVKVQPWHHVNQILKLRLLAIYLLQQLGDLLLDLLGLDVQLEQALALVGHVLLIEGELLKLASLELVDLAKQ